MPYFQGIKKKYECPDMFYHIMRYICPDTLSMCSLPCVAGPFTRPSANVCITFSLESWLFPSYKNLFCVFTNYYHFCPAGREVWDSGRSSCTWGIWRLSHSDSARSSRALSFFFFFLGRLAYHWIWSLMYWKLCHFESLKENGNF